VRAAVREHVLGCRAHQCLARATGCQGDRIAQGAAVAEFVAAAGAGEKVADFDSAGPFACSFKCECACEVARQVVVAERGHESPSSGGRDGVKVEDSTDEVSFARRVEVVRARVRRDGCRRHPEPHERPDRGDDDVGGLQHSGEVGGRGDVDLGRREFGAEAVGHGEHLGAVAPDQGRCRAAGEEFPEHALSGVSRRAQQHDPAVYHDSAFQVDQDGWAAAAWPARSAALSILPTAFFGMASITISEVGRL
jgi:hypothetical protein